MPASSKSSPSANEAKLIETIQGFKYDPLGHALFAYPWGEKNTPLHQYEGPRTWQQDEFKRISDHMADDLERQRMGLPPAVYYAAISSGRGPGKSAYLAMLANWLISCWIGSTGIITANTETQLRTRTMAELSKWNTMSINSHWFDRSAMKLGPAGWFKRELETQMKMDTQYYYVEGQTWSDDNPDAFAGAHSTVGMMVAMDEASGIPDPIWDVSEGFFTDLSGVRLWIVISNPRRNTGKFFDCFHVDSKFWNNRYIDSREVEGVDRQVYDRIVEKEGEDSDVTRVEVKGMFPRQGDCQFIGRDLVHEAQEREVEHDPYEPLIMGVDIARSGSAKNVVRCRRGRDAKSIPARKWRERDTMVTVTHIIKAITEIQPDAVMVDGGGVGGPVIDRLRQMGYNVIEVLGSDACYNKKRFENKRVEMWSDVRDWLSTGALDDDEDLSRDLTQPEEQKHPITNKIKLESKPDMIARGLKSTDDGDALSLTFARRHVRLRTGPWGGRGGSVAVASDVDYDVLNN